MSFLSGNISEILLHSIYFPIDPLMLFGFGGNIEEYTGGKISSLNFSFVGCYWFLLKYLLPGNGGRVFVFFISKPFNIDSYFFFTMLLAFDYYAIFFFIYLWFE